MAPVVSVIIRTYNRALLLQKAITSVLNQTFQDFEIIVVNNYSTDNTIEVVKSFNDERIKIVNIRNRGIIAKSHNVGLKESHGDYIAFLDDDDLWCPEKLEIQVEYLRKHLEYYLVYSNAWIVDETDVRKGLIMDLELFKEGAIFKDLVKCNFIPQLTVLMKREVFEIIGFFNEDPALRACDDYEYWLRVALRYIIGFVKEPLVMYRVHSGMMGHEINFAKQVQKILFSLLEDPSVPNKNEIMERIYELYYPSAMYNWKNSAKLTAKKELKKYLSYNLRHVNITNVFKALRFGVLFNFKYNNLKRIKDMVLKPRS
jgi:glycosyltransferase involved in cell wall biosynthesis